MKTLLMELQLDAQHPLVKYSVDFSKVAQIVHLRASQSLQASVSCKINSVENADNDDLASTSNYLVVPQLSLQWEFGAVAKVVRALGKPFIWLGYRIFNLVKPARCDMVKLSPLQKHNVIHELLQQQGLNYSLRWHAYGLQTNFTSQQVVNDLRQQVVSINHRWADNIAVDSEALLGKLLDKPNLALSLTELINQPDALTIAQVKALGATIAHLHYWGLEIGDLTADSLVWIVEGEEHLESNSESNFEYNLVSKQASNSASPTSTSQGRWVFLNLCAANFHTESHPQWVAREFKTLLFSLNQANQQGYFLHAHWHYLVEAYHDYFERLPATDDVAS